MDIDLTREVQAALTFQEYGGGATIDGATHTPLRKHRSLEGSFMELLRLSEAGDAEGHEGFAVRQVSISHAAPGRINAFHIHPKRVQDELWCVIQGELRVWLIDCRAGSPTEGARLQALLSGEAPGLLHIPSGVAHGYQAGTEGALLIYAMNDQFRIDDPNEGRLPWDHFGTELWDVDRG
ncbi:MAG: dTDP-4-dehydrorhamnose 3,5-epimerase [Armatimonadia bacterium]|nr:dTDP-4-dehydrorhamnose 3,5-epimerase [Armatimonadia bacterium]